MVKKQSSQLLKKKPYLYYDDILNLIYVIYKLHEDFSNDWFKKNDQNHLNLKKREVRDVCNIINEEFFILDNDFYSNIKMYISALNDFSIDIDLEYTYTQYDLTSRVKQNESIVNKLKFFQVAKEGKGSYAIRKCLNDLFGFRITIDDFDHECTVFAEKFDNFKNKHQLRIKRINASKNGYIGTHIYLYGNSNNFFPWELQIWNTKHAKKNRTLHEIHKQEYTKWASIYKNSVEIEER